LDGLWADQDVKADSVHTDDPAMIDWTIVDHAAELGFYDNGPGSRGHLV